MFLVVIILIANSISMLSYKKRNPTLGTVVKKYNSVVYSLFYIPPDNNYRKKRNKYTRYLIIQEVKDYYIIIEILGK